MRKSGTIAIIALLYVVGQGAALYGVFHFGAQLFGLKPVELVAASAVAVSFLGGLYASVVTLIGIQLKFGADVSIEAQKASNAGELEAYKQTLATQQDQLREMEVGLEKLREKCELLRRSLKRLETGDWDPNPHRLLQTKFGSCTASPRLAAGSVGANR